MKWSYLCLLKYFRATNLHHIYRLHKNARANERSDLRNSINLVQDTQETIVSN